MAKKILAFVKQIVLYLTTGILCGIVGTLFSKAVSLVTGVRGSYPWLLYLLPVAGLLSVVLYKWFGVAGMGTNHVIKATEEEKAVSFLLAPSVFLASLLSHLCGASVGREGAALQLGGGSAMALGKVFKLSKEQQYLLVYCGMAGVFSSVFGTPLSAAVFALEVVFVGRICLKAILPAFFTSFVSYFTAHFLGAHAERFSLTVIPNFSFSVIWKVALLGVLSAGLGMIFCFSLETCEKWFEKLIKNAYLRIAFGGILVIVLSIAVGTYDYNGAGVFVIERIFHDGEFVPFAFALKILFTCISVSAGYKGGEIVPTLFIGATFGALAGSFVGLSAPFSAALGMCGLFCAVTNCPLATILLGAELFGGKGIGYIALAVLFSYFLSGKISLYSAQKIRGFKGWF